jgi:riboflavin synthase alpha subunit
VASLGPDWFEVELIPATLQATNLRDLRSGDRVNLEGDILGNTCIILSLKRNFKPHLSDKMENKPKLLVSMKLWIISGLAG